MIKGCAPTSRMTAKEVVDTVEIYKISEADVL